MAEDTTVKLGGVDVRLAVPTSYTQRTEVWLAAQDNHVRGSASGADAGTVGGAASDHNRPGYGCRGHRSGGKLRGRGGSLGLLILSIERGWAKYPGWFVTLDRSVQAELIAEARVRAGQ